MDPQSIIDATAAAKSRDEYGNGDIGGSCSTGHMSTSAGRGAPTDAEIVQEETFGPVLVALRAESWPDALRLLNSVRQGLVASLFSTSQERWNTFCSTARAGVLRWNTATDGPVGDLPFGGWGTSGWGGAEHGEADPLFFTRHQTRLTGGTTR